MEQSDLEHIAQFPSTLALAQRINDSIPELRALAKTFLETVSDAEKQHSMISVANAEKHFQAAHAFWMNKDFVSLLFQMSHKHHYLFCLTESFACDTIYSLHHSRFNFIRKDPSLNEILIQTDPSVRIRGAISILIRYWCMEFMLVDYFFKEIGLFALGIEEISLLDNVARVTDDPLNEFSPIKQLVNVASIQCLARDVGGYPKLVGLAQELLISLEEDTVEEPGVFLSPEEEPYARHCRAMWEFWLDQDFRVLMREHLIKDPHLLVMVKMFSDRFKREITMDRLQCLSRCTELRLFMDNNGGYEMINAEPVDMIRCAFAIMTRYWACVGVALKVREKRGMKPCDGIPKIKYDADFKDEKIGDVIYYPVHNINGDPDDVWLTRWYEENQTEISLLLDKEWRDVLTGRYSGHEAEIKSLLGKIAIDKRMKLVLKKDSVGNLCMTCTI